jgi:hypothetical protein
MQDTYELGAHILEKCGKETRRELIIKLTECAKQNQKLHPWVIKAKLLMLTDFLACQATRSRSSSARMDCSGHCSLRYAIKSSQSTPRSWS